MCSILHSVVLNLIIESGVNWSRDERLFALFMMDPKVPFPRARVLAPSNASVLSLRVAFFPLMYAQNLVAATAAVPSK